MSTLVLVRHGQARALEPPYDRLSPAGVLQARKLGEYWAARGVTFDQVWTGALERQKHTEVIVAERCREAGRRWPEAREDAAFNEYDAENIFRKLPPMLSQRDPAFQKLWEAQLAKGAGPEGLRHFQKIFDAVMPRWQDGSLAATGVEPWSAFRARVAGAIGGMVENGGRGRRIAVFTSGGMIGLAVALALRAPDPSALDVNLRVRNCSLTEFRFRPGRLSLDAFNLLPHIEEPELITFW
ncbi:MAG TPA: histidine phosphatase family protein [Bryobacterales bacterium]|nr:histidine phosphatase family protein [Bryobacterales bacterium]